MLLDEVETLAADRSKLSLQANPVDVHRADGCGAGFSSISWRSGNPNLLFSGDQQLSASSRQCLYVPAATW